MIRDTIIAVFCYKRAAKLKLSIEALLKNAECASMEIIFFCDGFKNENDKLGVVATRKYIDSVTGFKKVHKHFREKNLSTGPNFQAGFKYLCENYDQFIVIEDDLVVTPNYISYLLGALDFYRDKSSVFCITGFCFPLEIENYHYDTIVHSRFCSYGWASWSDRIRKVVWDNEGLKKVIELNSGFKNRLNSEGYDLYRMLKKQLKGKISTWDIQMQVHIALHRLKVIYPVISKGANIGFDNESTNTFGVDYLKTPQDSGEKTGFKFCEMHITEPSLQKQLRKPYSFPELVNRKLTNTVIKFASRISLGKRYKSGISP